MKCILMNKKGFYKPFNIDRSLKNLVRIDTDFTTKKGLKVIKFYNYYHPNTYFFTAGDCKKWFSHAIQCINSL